MLAQITKTGELSTLSKQFVRVLAPLLEDREPEEEDGEFN